MVGGCDGGGVQGGLHVPHGVLMACGIATTTGGSRWWRGVGVGGVWGGGGVRERCVRSVYGFSLWCRNPKGFLLGGGAEVCVVRGGGCCDVFSYSKSQTISEDVDGSEAL